MSNRTITVSFEAQGVVKQRVVLKRNISAAELESGLESRKYVTTIQENHGTIEVLATGEIIAEIQSVDNELEYSDFKVEE